MDCSVLKIPEFVEYNRQYQRQLQMKEDECRFSYCFNFHETGLLVKRNTLRLGCKKKK